MSAAGWSLLPLKQGGKTPLTPHGFQDASRYRTRILEWRQGYPRCNWGRALEPGALVLDIDGEQGRESLAALEAAQGSLPVTLTARTGGGGEHRYFALPEGVSVRCSAGKLGKGLDIRSEGGFVVLPPSLHESGNRYEWIVRHKPAECPVWLLSLLGEPAGAPIVPQGQRHPVLLRLAGAMRRVGADEEAIYAALEVANRNCAPPKPDSEVRRLARDVAGRYAPNGGSIGVLMSEVQPEAVRWLWPGRIPLGKLTVLDGDPSLGKSTITLDIAARVSCGLPMPDGTAGVSGGVVLASAEDGLADTVRPRLEAAGADCARIVALKPEQFLSVGQLDELRASIERVNAVLVVVDPIMAYLGPDVNSWRDQDVRRLLAPLAALAEESGAAIVLIRHLRKAADANPLYRGGGSIGIIGAARSGLLVARDPDDPERRVLAATKANLAKEAPSLSYRMVEINGAVKIEWLGESHHAAAALLAVPPSNETRNAMGEAADWLRSRLADGPVAAQDIRCKARGAGYSHRTLARAKDRLGVTSNKCGFGDGWQWELPKDANPPKDANISDLALFGETPVNMAISPKDANPADIGCLRRGCQTSAESFSSEIHGSEQ